METSNGNTRVRLPAGRGWAASLQLCLIAVLASSAALVVALRASDAAENESAAARARYVGSDQCASCHPAQHADWLSSQHKAAMQVATEATVLGDFSGSTFSAGGVTATFFKKDQKFWVRTDGADGKPADFEIGYTFGVYPLQQYLIELPGGRLQAFGIAWDARAVGEGGQRWYHLYPNDGLKAGDPLHWTGIDQNWNYQCAFCHSTDLEKNYDPATRTFKTTWSEISVGCEACHGPGSGHMTWASGNEAARAGGAASTKGLAVSFDERHGVRWAMGESGQAARSVPRSSGREIEACAACHSRRGQFASTSGGPGSLYDAFRPAGLESGLYFSDGQQRDEVYTFGSFLQSRMHGAGVTCSDCHNPHTGKLRVSGNAVCTQCHAAQRFDAVSHHRHSAGSEGAKCVSCHMPTTTYMGVDARHDHSLRIARPDRSIFLGTPNACNGCHRDKSAAWAKDAIQAWYPSPKPGFQEFADAFDLADRMAPGAQAALLDIVRSQATSPIVRASAIARASRFASPEVLKLAAFALGLDEPQVQEAAIAIVAFADDDTRRSLLVPMLRSRTRLVRMAAARALAGRPMQALQGEDLAAFKAARDEYVAAQLFNAERPESHLNLGHLYRDEGNADAARTSFEAATGLDKSFVAASISLADLERTSGGEAAAEAILRKALAENPASGATQHALGLSLIRLKRFDEALGYLAKAVESEPDDPRHGYVLGVALHDTGKRAEAVSVLKNTLLRHPYDRDVLMALASYEAEAGDLDGALEAAELLLRLEPGRQDYEQLVARLNQERQR